MTTITRSERAFYVIVALSALWVGSWCFFVPDQVLNGIPWFAPPLHARFIGSIYLSAAVFCAGAALARSASEVRAIPPMIAAWTGIVFLVSLIYLTGQHYRRPPIWIWLVAYLVYPLIALWLWWMRRSDPSESGGTPLPEWARRYLLIQGIVLSICGLVLLFAPRIAVQCWPWRLTALLAQVYSGPILCYAIGSLLLSRRRFFRDVRIAVIGNLVFVLGALIASLLHLESFDFRGPAAWLWFGGFVVAAVALLLMVATALRSGK
jgi:hypothetical protein